MGFWPSRPRSTRFALMADHPPCACSAAPCMPTRSAPAVNALSPEPVTTPIQMSSRASISRMRSEMAVYISESIAFIFSGRSRVMIATWPSTSNLIDISASLPAGGGAHSFVSSQDCEAPGSKIRSTSLQELTTVDADDRSGHVARLVADQEANELRDVLGFAVQVHRVGLQVPFLQVIDDRARELR